MGSHIRGRQFKLHEGIWNPAKVRGMRNGISLYGFCEDDIVGQGKRSNRLKAIASKLLSDILSNMLSNEL